MTEQGFGSDAFSMQTQFEKQGDKYLLNGSKLYITNASVSDVVIVLATSSPGHGFAGASAFLIEKDTPGFQVSRPLEKMGLRTSPMGEIVLNNCEVGSENRLGNEGAGTSEIQRMIIARTLGL